MRYSARRERRECLHPEERVPASREIAWRIERVYPSEERVRGG
jgi:hypothetical protein